MGCGEDVVLGDDGTPAVVAEVHLGRGARGADLDLGDPGVVAVLGTRPVQNVRARLQQGVAGGKR